MILWSPNKYVFYSIMNDILSRGRNQDFTVETIANELVNNVLRNKNNF